MAKNYSEGIKNIELILSGITIKFVENATIMSTAILRQKLHSYLEIAGDKKVKAIYAIMENEIERSAMEYTNDIKMELDSRYADYRNGKTKVVKAAESRKRIQKILKSTGRK